MRRLSFVLLAMIIGCETDEPGQKPQECDPSSQIRAWADADGDGDGDPATETSVCELGQGFVANGDDCDDSDAAISFDAAEICDGIDQDCDTIVDDGLIERTWYADTDGDGYGDPNTPVKGCDQPPASALDKTDCDDAHADAYPGAPEVCDGYDNNCDGVFDDADPNLDPLTTTIYYPDRDKDGFGDDAMGTPHCANPNPAQFTETPGDCDDSNAVVMPGGTEVCDTIDNNCDLLVDEEDPTLDPAELTTFYEDLDQDGVGNDLVLAEACFEGNGYASVGGDCNDNEPLLQGPKVWVADADDDGIGAGPDLGPPSCVEPGPNTAPDPVVDDCDDADPLRFPGNKEICGDGLDQDCSGTDQSCGPIGSFKVGDGPLWSVNPPTYTCLEACALLFGGVDTDYQCSTSKAKLDNQAFVSGWGDGTYCTTPVAEDFKKAATYNCGAVGCAYSAYVTDHCTSGETNYCWPN